MAESFVNSLTRAVGIVTTATGGAIAAGASAVTGISTAGIGVSDLVDNTNFIAGTKIYSVGVGVITCTRSATNTVAATSQSLTFLGPTTALTAADKSILIGGTFANNTDSSVGVALASKIPVPAGSSFVITDAGKTLLETSDELRVYADSANAIDVNLSILKGVS